MARQTRKQKIIQNYYDNRDSIMIQSLSEVVSELYLASDDRRRGQLWRRAETALKNLKIPPEEAKQILIKRDIGALARIVSTQF
jgi:hypothetical protein